MGNIFCFWKQETRSTGRAASSRRNALGRSIYHRRLRCEALEDRRLLSLTTVTVENLSDSGAGSLRQAIADVADGGTITFDIDLAGGTIDLESTLSTSKDLTITGLGDDLLTIDGSDYSGILLHISGNAAVAVSGLTMSDGEAFAEHGGAINATGTLTVSDCTFSLNTGVSTGAAAIYNWGTTTIRDCTFSSNTGGATVYGWGALAIDDSTFSGNSDVAVFFYSDSGDAMTVTGCDFTANAASAYGVIYCSSDGTAAIDECTFSGNSGSSIYNDSGCDTTVTDSTIAGTLACESYISAAVQNVAGTLTISECTLSGNTRGGIRNAYLSSPNSLTILNSTIAENGADATNGIFAVTNYGTLVVKNSTIAGNAICGISQNRSSGATTLQNTIVADNGYDVDGPVAANYCLIENPTLATITGDHNILGEDPKLSGLGDHGGSTQTMTLLDGSPAIDAGSNALVPLDMTTDQRGLTRKVHVIVDLGAVEDQAPTVATAAAADPDNVTATTTHLTVLGADDRGESSLTYIWAVTSPLGAVAPTFSVNTSNAAKNTTATFHDAGDYTFTVTIADTDGLTVTSSVIVTVDQTLTTILVSPTSASLNAAATQQFTAVGYDQFDDAMTAQPTFAWATTVGSISSAGLFTAPQTSATGTVTATAGLISDSSDVTVTNHAPTVATAAAAVPSPATATTTNLSVLGADTDTGESSLTYDWAVTTKPVGAATPTFSVNTSNAAKNTTATFHAAGQYAFTVTITDPGALTTTSSVTVTVSQTLTTIAVSPTSATLKAGGKQQFTAVGRDQFGVVLTTQPTFTWATTAGTISAGGLLTAPSQAVSTGTVTATRGSISDTAAFHVTNVGPTISKVAVSASKGTITWNLYASVGVKSTSLKVDGKQVTKVYGPRKAASGVNYWADFGKLAVGSHTYKITATDKSGRVSTSTGTFTVAGPTISKVVVKASSQEAAELVKGTMTWNLYDSVGVKSTSLKVDGKQVTKVYGPYKAASGANYAAFGSLSTGSHTYKITATDTFGRVSTLTGAFNVTSSSSKLLAAVDTVFAGVSWNDEDSD